jgi:hypothetical protein
MSLAPETLLVDSGRVSVVRFLPLEYELVINSSF